MDSRFASSKTICAQEMSATLARFEMRMGIFFSTWNCLNSALNDQSDNICDGDLNSDTDQYVCCADRDYCNQDIRIELPIERPTPTPTTETPLVATTTEEAPESGSNC